MKDIEQKYMRNHNRYYTERALLATMDKAFLQNLIQEKWEEATSLRNQLKAETQELMQQLYYEFLPEISQYLLQRIIFEFRGWPELIQIQSNIESWKYMLQLKYENKRDKDSLTRRDILRVKEIPIDLLVEKFVWVKIPQSEIIHCPFHPDTTGSLKIYPHTNSFYCFGCQKGWTTIEFTANFLEISNKEAIKELKNYFTY